MSEKRDEQRSDTRPETIPVPLYVYLPAHAALDDLLHLHLKLSDARKVNDPFEYAWELDYPMTDEEKESYVLHYKDEYSSKMMFLSFSLECDNGLMWAYYTRNRAGMCLGFDFSTWIPSGDIEFDKVNYDAPTSIAAHNRTDDEQISLLKRLLISKQPIWIHEKEWRALVPKNSPLIETRGKTDFFVRIPTQTLKTVVFGDRCSIEDMGRSMLACLKRGITPTFCRLKPNYAKCKLEVVPVVPQEGSNYMTVALLHGFSPDTPDK